MTTTTIATAAEAFSPLIWASTRAWPVWFAGELRVAVDILSQAEANLGLIVLSHQARAGVSSDFVTHGYDRGIRQMKAGRWLIHSECAGHTDNCQRRKENVAHDLAPRIFSAERSRSAAAAAMSDKELRLTNIAAAAGCSDWFGGSCPWLLQPILQFWSLSLVDVSAALLHRVRRRLSRNKTCPSQTFPATVGPTCHSRLANTLERMDVRFG
jgi:hypothetical protein